MIVAGSLWLHLGNSEPIITWALASKQLLVLVVGGWDVGLVVEPGTIIFSSPPPLSASRVQRMAEKSLPFQISKAARCTVGSRGHGVHASKGQENITRDQDM